MGINIIIFALTGLGFQVLKGSLMAPLLRSRTARTTLSKLPGRTYLDVIDPDYLVRNDISPKASYSPRTFTHHKLLRIRPTHRRLASPLARPHYSQDLDLSPLHNFWESCSESLMRRSYLITSTNAKVVRTCLTKGDLDGKCPNIAWSERGKHCETAKQYPKD